MQFLQGNKIDIEQTLIFFSIKFVFLKFLQIISKILVYILNEIVEYRRANIMKMY